MAQSSATEEAGARTTNLLLCCKSIDKLISEAEDPEHRLSKSLGPWSLTALGIGAIIGSGIFVLTGTAAAGEYFQAPSNQHAQELEMPFVEGAFAVRTAVHPPALRLLSLFSWLRSPAASLDCAMQNWPQ